jgi:type II secretory pathway component PulJ
MSTLRQERGFTAFELLWAATIFIVILGAVLSLLDGFQRTTRANEMQNVSQDAARSTIDRLSTELRNAGGQEGSILEAESTAVTFTTVDTTSVPVTGGNEANVMRVRYCLTGTTLVRQEQTWTAATTPGLPPMVNCPEVGASWSASQTVAENLVNTTTKCAPTAAAAPCPVFTFDDATPLTDVKSIGIHLVIDDDTDARPLPSTLETAVAIRNQVIE